MKETIYTIPISEVFEPKKGCPICSLADALEERWVQYITGAAMMEPDVRVKTNEAGFCARHLTAMLGQRNRLSVALLLQTRLEYLLKNQPAPPASGFSLKKKRETEVTSCFVCGQVERELLRLTDNLAAVWSKEEGFRRLYNEQEYICAPHHKLLIRAGQTLRGARAREFADATNKLLRCGLEPVKADIDAFCRLFDYRSNAETRPSEQVSSAVERAASILCGNLFSNPDQ